MTIYRIEILRIHENNKTLRDIIPIDYTNLQTCNSAIKDYAEAWRKEATLIQHHAGQSVVFLTNFRIEFTRLPSEPCL